MGKELLSCAGVFLDRLGLGTRSGFGLRQGGIQIDSKRMRVFGIDCGTDCTGYGVVEWAEFGVAGSREPCLVALASGGIRLPKSDTMPQKLGFVYRELMLLLAAHQPEVVAIEEVFYSANVKSALKLGQIRGVALLAAANCGLPVAEYAPLKIKSSVVGYGLAQKEQVQFMVTRLLRLECVPEPADAADALAVAICHLHTAQTLVAQAPSGRSGGR
jgi:crossover junction endodeoxyribonuclease RuvC